MKAIVQRYLNDAGLNQHLGQGQVQTLEGGFDLVELGLCTPYQYRVIEFISHDPDASQHGRGTDLPHRSLGGIAIIDIAETARATRSNAYA